MNISQIKHFLKKRIDIYTQKVKYGFFNNNSKLKKEYVDWLFNRNQNGNGTYVGITDDDITDVEKKIKLIAFYLPQFYENEVNNENFGKGFMEWYKVTKALPQYTGHNQPQLPIDVGFYNLSHDDVMYRQIELAKKYGIYGFCFYYYWFSGDRLLEKPLEHFLNNKELRMPFCLFWANETWTHVWDTGHNAKIIKNQELRDDDDDKFVKDIIKYFQDERYIKIDNKPVLIIYKMQIFEKNRFKQFINNLKEKIKDYGFDDIYLIATDNYFGEMNLSEYKIDAVVEFSNQYIFTESKISDMKNRFVNPSFNGKIIDLRRVLDEKKHLINAKNYKTYKSVCAGWDDTARKAYTGSYVLDMTPDDFERWLKDDIEWTKSNHSESEQILFIDSWNEWAEGAHLEPDQRYGYAYLQKVLEAVK